MFSAFIILLQVLVNIVDVNDNLPLFDTTTDYNISIVEHIPNGFEIMQFHAIDHDEVRGSNFLCYTIYLFR